MRRWFAIALVLILAGGVAVALFFFRAKYHTHPEMTIPLEEVTTASYPNDPAQRSTYYGRYSNRQLELIDKGDGLFDFIFESDDPNLATITVRNVDLALFVPAVPEWAKGDSDLEVISLVEREWNRQQVAFEDVEITGGDGFEQRQLTSVQIARNCLNAGLWEVLLFTGDGLYYQGWFDFPLGHYQRVFKAVNGFSYFGHWYRLEHWIDPAGRTVDLNKLRTPLRQWEPPFEVLSEEEVFASGEQKRKLRTLDAPNVRTWGDFHRHADTLGMATFAPPGRYFVEKNWGNELGRLATLDRVEARKVSSPATDEMLDEIELVFIDSESGKEQRLIISGFVVEDLPVLPPDRYPEGFYMPMGISVPPVNQDYEDLVRNPPYESAYFNVLIDEDGEWINHHKVAIDGIAMHRDPYQSDIVHVYPLSYERHTLLGHYRIQLGGPRPAIRMLGWLLSQLD